jgi:lysozyme
MDIVEQLERDEGGFQPKPYDCGDGKVTIGIGRNLTDDGISEDEGRYLFDNDLRQVRAEIVANVPFFFQLNDARQGVLLNMCFNMGIHHLMQREKMLEAMEAGDWKAAESELRTFHNYVGQVGDRARRLAEQLTTGEWQ